MADATQSVQVRRIAYHALPEPIGTVAYQFHVQWNDHTASVQDPVMRDDPYTPITGYLWDFYKKEWYSNPE